MSKRLFKLKIIDIESNGEVFEHYFNYEDGKIKFLPSGKEMKKSIKHFSEMESEFDPK